MKSYSILCDWCRKPMPMDEAERRERRCGAGVAEVGFAEGGWGLRQDIVRNTKWDDLCPSCFGEYMVIARTFAKALKAAAALF